MSYYFSLISTPFSSDSNNTLFFETPNDQQIYFNELARGKWSSLANFNFYDNVNTSITYVDESNRSIEELLRCNYLVLKNEEGTEYRYFFANPRHNSFRQLVVDLNLDVIQTYYFKYRNDFQKSFIKRAHLNRFPLANSKKIPVDSVLYKKESFDFTKFSDNLIELSSSDFVIYVNLYLSINATFKLKNTVRNRGGNYYIGTDETEISNYLKPFTNTINNININSDIGLISIPFDKTIIANSITLPNPAGADKPRIKINYNMLSYNEIFNLINRDDIYSITISFMKPTNYNIWSSNEFKMLPLSTEWRSGGVHGEYVLPNYTEVTTINGYEVKYTNVEVVNDSQDNYEVNIYIVPLPTTSTNQSKTFNIDFSSIYNPDYTDKYYNPKVVQNNITNFSLISYDNKQFEYDFDKLFYDPTNSSESLNFIYEEIISPITTHYRIYLLNNYKYYPFAVSKNTYFGIRNSVDNGLPFTTDKYSTFVNNQRNAFAQNIFGSTFNGLSTLIQLGLVGSISSRGVIGGATIGTTGLALTMLENYYKKDELRNAKWDITDNSYDVLLNYATTGLKLRIYTSKPIESELQMFNEYIFRNGFLVEEYGNLSDYDNIREDFNYIECDLEVSNIPISNNERMLLKEKLNSGVRFFNNKVISYEVENKEKGRGF